jgi:hypothetical protein
MRRVLLLLEEYNELLYLEAFLKKLGFDTVGFQKPVLLERKLLGFSPHLLITQVRGKRWTGFEVLKPLRSDSRRLPTSCKILGLQRGGESLTPEEQELYSGLAQSPIAPVSFLGTVANVLEMDSEALVKKFKVLNSYREVQASQEIISESEPKLDDRESKYDKIVSSLPPVGRKTLPGDVLREHAQNGPQPDEATKKKIKQVHQDKQAFLQALMKAKA